MEGLIVLLILLAIGCIISGPVALIISIIALKNIKQILYQFHWQERKISEIEVQKPPATIGRKIEVEKAIPLSEPIKTVDEKEKKKIYLETIVKADTQITQKNIKDTGRQGLGLEQRIGTKWILIAGVITVIFAVGFFLKYAYDNDLIGPLGRVIIAAVTGLIALAVGETTRRRGYGIAAKSVTALGFAILYAAVFAARAYYDLIGPTPAFILAILVTIAAMLYAVSLDEIAVAVLSLLGGFLTPALISTGKNLPTPLFVYVLILSVGALMCAYYRKWRAVNLLSFAGTFLLYTGWFEKFYRPAIRSVIEMPEQMPVALAWLAIFFVIYLVLPVLHELLKKLKAKKEDVLLILCNAAVVFYYLWMTLFKQYRTALAFCALGLCVTHLIMMKVVTKRCREDRDLRLALLGIGLLFLTVAIPLYLKMYAIAIAWAIEGAVLMFIGLRYRSIWTQLGGVAALLLSFGQLMHHLPLHRAAFTLVFNPAFGTWCLVAGILIVCHILYRSTSQLTEEQRNLITQSFYGAAILMLLAAAAMEWYWNCDYNISDNATGDRLFHKGMVIILLAFPLLMLTRPIAPKGMICRFMAATLAGAGAIFIAITFVIEFYGNSFMIFLNTEFSLVLLFVASLFIDAWLLYKNREDAPYARELAIGFAMAGICILWVLLTEEIYLYWYCKDRFSEKIGNWKFLAQMYISIMWAIYGAALMIVGFWRKYGILRYMSLGLFALLLVKVFILDTSTVKSVYRIGAFLATGITLVAVSYLYQYLRKKGFFEAVPSETNPDK